MVDFPIVMWQFTGGYPIQNVDSNVDQLVIAWDFMISWWFGMGFQVEVATKTI